MIYPISYSYRLLRQGGFTLVELAIVLIIVSLLIGGILKGMELIGNSEITAVTGEFKGLEAATSAFFDQFHAVPGDFAEASTRIVGCTANPCTFVGPAPANVGNGVLDVPIGGAPSLTNEATWFYNQLRLAYFLKYFDGTNFLAFGNALPASQLRGGYIVGDTRVLPMQNFTATEMRSGVYLILTADLTGVNDNTGAVTPSQAARIDRKIDDGRSDNGRVISETTADCRDGAGTGYNENANDRLCAVAYKVK